MYAELHALSNFSFLRGASQPEELVAQAKALGYRALALTDECSLAGRGARAHRGEAMRAASHHRRGVAFAPSRRPGVVPASSSSSRSPPIGHPMARSAV